MWLGWNYTPLCWSQLLCHFLRGPRVILPRPGRFIEWLHCNSYMVEGPMARITHGDYTLSAIKGVTALMNGSLHTVCLFSIYFFLVLSNTYIQSLLNRVKYPNSISPLPCFKCAHYCQHLSLSLSITEGNQAFTQNHDTQISFYLCCAQFSLFTVTRAPCGEAKQPVWMFTRCYVCLYAQLGSVAAVDWMCLIRLLGGWRWKLTPVPSQPVDHGLVEMWPTANSGLELSLE